MPDPIAVNSMFGRIARRYDVANFVLCGGIDTWWRKKLVLGVRRSSPRKVLDLATGSGDVAFAISRGVKTCSSIVGMDFCLPMLEQAEAKKRQAGQRYQNVHFAPGDALALPVADESYDAVTISFGLRNLADRARGLQEMRRVLRPGGRLFVLEFSQPAAWFRPCYYFYLRHVLPTVAGLVTSDKDAYVYLNNTISQFPDRTMLADEIRAAGFRDVTAEALTFGVVALHTATR
jgi:demethylmenaquinone methyltransferase/2-methoxy-6-polyprenyl-1,4-benzoquinol methylase